MIKMRYRTKSPKLIYDQEVFVESEKQGERLIKIWNRVNKTQSSDYIYHALSFERVFLGAEQDKCIPLKESDSNGYVHYLSKADRGFKVVEDRR